MRLLLATGNAQGKNLRMVTDKDGNIPLLCAIEIGNVPVARELLLSSTQDQLKTGKGAVGDCAIHLAARKGDNDLVKLFIESGTKVDTQNVSQLAKMDTFIILCVNSQEEGQTCLHIACSRGDENIIRTLYLARANPSVMDKEDRFDTCLVQGVWMFI